MSGNRKHGFMRGSAAGRNGVGTPKGFYCEVCSKEHGRTVERTLYKGKMMCDRQYYKLKETEFREQNNQKFKAA